MASGKTRIGSLLAKNLGWRFIDTDEEIKRAEGCSIADIFANRGEAHFRKLETRAIGRAARGARQVVAVGGGAVMDLKNIRIMRKNGVVVYLKAPFKLLFRRAEDQGKALRPLWQGKNALERRRNMAKLCSLRRPLYKEAAHLTLNTMAQTAQQVSAVALGRLFKEGWISP